MSVKIPDPESVMGFQGTIAYVKAGTKIYASSSHYTTSMMGHISHRFRFYEYKLSSLAPQIAMPDWDYAAQHRDYIVDLSSSWCAAGGRTIEKDGFLFITHGGRVSGTGGNAAYTVAVNDYPIDVAGSSSDNEVESSALFPVSKGDTLTWSGIAASGGGFFRMEFVPAK